LTDGQIQEIYDLQLDLNNRILGEKFGLNILKLDEQQMQTWLLNFCRATIHELIELKDAFWNGDEQNIIVEAVDTLHFLVSIGQVLKRDAFGALNMFDWVIGQCEPTDELLNLSWCVESTVDLEDTVAWKWWGTKTIDWKETNYMFDNLLIRYHVAMHLIGITDDQLYSVYIQKNAINHQRQDKGYNLDTKTEDDNLSIKIGGTDD
jgi:dimeric dUTPase (all-alpha-NTP-PPase superfamily)